MAACVTVATAEERSPFLRGRWDRHPEPSLSGGHRDCSPFGILLRCQPSRESLKYPILSASRYLPKINDSSCYILIPTNLNPGEEDRNCLFLHKNVQGCTEQNTKILGFKHQPCCRHSHSTVPFCLSGLASFSLGPLWEAGPEGRRQVSDPSPVLSQPGTDHGWMRWKEHLF